MRRTGVGHVADLHPNAASGCCALARAPLARGSGRRCVAGHVDSGRGPCAISTRRDRSGRLCVGGVVGRSAPASRSLRGSPVSIHDLAMRQALHGCADVRSTPQARRDVLVADNCARESANRLERPGQCARRIVRSCNADRDRVSLSLRRQSTRNCRATRRAGRLPRLGAVTESECRRSPEPAFRPPAWRMTAAHWNLPYGSARRGGLRMCCKG